MTSKQRNLRYTGKTIGDSIDNLANAFSGKADTMGLYILKAALEKAQELKSQDERNAEFDGLMKHYRKTL